MMVQLCTSAATIQYHVRACNHSCFALSASGSEKVEKLQVKFDKVSCVCDRI